ncbi:MAG: efflux RND transporter periplasmic adaptor subunit [Planctomycetaceae bacterium]|nr:efflux RND transporter periplasmic adaptor subunit [Planctomycetaceae bacterium]
MTLHKLALTLIALCTASASAALAQEGGIKALTRPRDNVTLAFVVPGRIAEIPVKAGQPVRKGQLLARLDDSAERLKTAQLKAAAEDQTRVKAAEAQLAQKRVDLERTEGLFKKQVASKYEYEHARLEVTIGELSLALARHEQELNVLKHQEAQAQLERMAIVSPVDGQVEDVIGQVGQSVDLQAKIMTLVVIDPLWADAPVPVEQAAAIKLGDAAKVDFGAGRVIEAKVVYVAAMADAASQTRTIRVEIPNAQSRGGGDHVTVRFTMSTAAASATTRPSAAIDPDKTD